jgi:hypothetical protein
MNYSYAYSAVNIFGESARSASVTIQAVSVPSKMNAPVLQVIGTEVKISWLQPDNGGTPILGYHIFFFDNSITTPAYVEYVLLCDGTNATIKSQ